MIPDAVMLRCDSDPERMIHVVYACMHTTAYPLIYVPICLLMVYLSAIYLLDLFICLSLSACVAGFVCMSINSSVGLPFGLSIHPSIHPSINRSTYLSKAYQPISYLSNCVSAHLCIYLSIYLSASTSVCFSVASFPSPEVAKPLKLSGS